MRLFYAHATPRGHLKTVRVVCEEYQFCLQLISDSFIISLQSAGSEMSEISTKVVIQKVNNLTIH